MLITVPMPHEPGSPYPPSLPPPLLPKPAKDNLRLQKLLKKAAKKKANITSLQSGSFRASLSPVSEASHDQDAGPQPCSEAPRAPAPPAPLAFPDPPHILLPSTRSSSYKPVIQHVSSPLQKKSFSFNLTEQRSLAEHFRVTTPQFRGPAPDTPKPSGSLAPASASTAVTHISRVHIHVQPVLSPAPVLTLPVGGGGNGELGPPRTEHRQWPGDQEQGVATPKLVPHQPQIPVVHIQPLSPNAQGRSPQPETPSTTRLSPSVEAAAPKQVITKIVVPIAPTYRSTGPPQHNPLPKTPSAKTEPPPVPPKPTTVTPKFIAVSDTRQISSPSTAFSPDPPRHPVSLVSSVLSPAPGGETPPAAPTPTPRPRSSGWTRLKKQLIVDPEVLPFPEPEDTKGQPEQPGKGPSEPTAGPSAPRPLLSRATKMWDAVLYRMSVAKSGPPRKDTEEGAQAPSEGLPGSGDFLPFLYRPRFDARKLREMAAQPPGARASNVLGASLRPSLAPKNFNRTAACWQLK